MDEILEAYCVKCKAKREIKDPEPVFTKTGRPATRGVCPVCGTTLFRMGETPAHEGLPRPKVTSSPRRRSGRGKNSGKKDVPRKGKLVIVESPAKARTVGRFLGKGYTVKASVGHVRDLLKSRLSVDIENDFKPEYRVPNEKRAIVKELKEAAARAEEIFLATDPDREGEAIAWHLIESAEIDESRVRRVVFHEITKPAIEEAFAHPRGINQKLVEAQQARRILDRLVGYQIGPILWKKVRSRLTAGRVQSVAVRLVVEREREIENFVPEEYWTLDAELSRKAEDGKAQPPSFTARLVKVNGEKAEFHSEDEIRPHLEVLEGAEYIVKSVKKGTKQRRPTAPFTTSTMQQEASRKLGFGARRTMRIAQQLYEGIDIGEGGAVGLITYMRTDSTNVAVQAQKEAREFIVGRYGEQFVPEKPPIYKTKTKGAQEAHEAIRPTSVFREPKSLKDRLSPEQYRLYDLIWRRFVASQMSPAIYDTMRVEIEAGPPGKPKPPYLFRASGSKLRFPGFLAVYEESTDEPAEKEHEGTMPPPLEKGDPLLLVRLLPEQHFTKPPARYTEASLVKALEEYGIGRPSTYAPIIATIQNRGYVRKEGRTLYPTETGILVNDLLTRHFPDIVDTGFTAQMEEKLDLIAAGKLEWVPMLREFYAGFEKELREAEEKMPVMRVEEKLGRDCPECGSPLIVRWGRYGKFIGCSAYPKCRYTEPWLEKIGVKCPLDGGDIVEKRTRKGRIFYGCSNYPKCDFTSWKRPIPQPCPECGGLLVMKNRQTAQCLSCNAQIPLSELAEVEAEPKPTPEG